MTYQAANTQESPYETLAKQYMESHPEVTITLNPQPNDSYGQTLRTQLQAGNAPDIIQTSPGRGQANSVVELAEAGFLAPLGETAASLVLQGNESLFGVDDKIYGQPMELTVTGVVYNVTAAENAGLAEYPADFDALLRACDELSSQSVAMFAVAGSAPPNTGMMAMSISASRVYAEDPDWNDQRAAGTVTFSDSEGWRTTLETIEQLHDGGCLQGGVEAGGFDAITSGLGSGSALSAFVPSATALEISNAVPDATLEIEPFPAVSEADSYLLASSNYSLSINETSTQAEAAQAFLDWLAEPEQAVEFSRVSGALPVTGIGDTDLSDSIYAPVADLLESESYAPLPNNSWPNSEVYDALGVGVQGLFTGQKSVDQVLADMDAAWGQ